MPLTSREKVSSFRERAIAAGLCMTCGGGIEPGRNCATCKTCSQAAYERVKRRRAAKKA